MNKLSRYRPPDHYDDESYDGSDDFDTSEYADLSEEEKEQILACLREPELHPEDVVMDAVLWFDRGVFDDYPNDILDRVIEAIIEFKFQLIADEHVKNGERLLQSVPRRAPSTD